MESNADGSTDHDTKSCKLVNCDRRHSVAFADFAINNPRSSITVSCTLLFAMSQLFFGVVIPLSDSFVTNYNKDNDHAYYLEAFLMVQYITAIVSVFYLQGYVYIHSLYQKRNQKKGKEDLVENDDVNDELVEIDCQKVTFDLPQQASGVIPTDSNIELSSPSFSPNSFQMNNLSSNIINDDKTSFLETKIIKSSTFNNYFIIRESNGINLYLRLGAVGFGFGVMVHDGFKIADKVRLDGSCYNQLWTPKQCLHLAYIFVQTFFIFKYHRSIFLKQKGIVRFILYHLTISNICQWFKTVVYEINHELKVNENENGLADLHGKINSSFDNSTCSNKLSHIVSPYLFPCAIEYSLISAAIFYKMLQRVGEDLDDKPYPEKTQTQIVVKNVKYSECHRAHKGLFVGLLFFMVTLVGLAIFLVLKKSHEKSTLAIMVYQVSEIILLVSSSTALVCAFVKMRKLRFCQLTEEEALDDNLLLVGLAGVFAYNLFLFISTIDSNDRLNKDKPQIAVSLFLCKSLTEIIQSLLQVLFVLEASRKCAQTFHDVKIKPGRSLVTFLIVTNLALWTVSIFEAKRAGEHLMFTNYYHKTPWSIITHTLLPLIIFFRFHSTICLTDIWTKAYKMRIAT